MCVPAKVQEIIWKTLGYIALRRLPPKGQPTNTTIVASNIENFWLHYTCGCAT